MPQRTATIESLPMAFAAVKEMRADGLEWGEGYRPLGRQALAEIIQGRTPSWLRLGPPAWGSSLVWNGSEVSLTSTKPDKELRSGSVMARRSLMASKQALQ